MQRAAVTFDSPYDIVPEKFKIGSKTSVFPSFFTKVLEQGKAMCQDPLIDEEMKAFFEPIEAKGILVAPLISSDHHIIGLITWFRIHPPAAPDKIQTQLHLWIPKHNYFHPICERYS